MIEEDQAKASDFLNDFAELYRYVLEVSNKKLVSIKEELTFVQAYFRMMQYKLGNSYQLQLIAPAEINGFIAPLALQLLVENAIEHNIGKVNDPVNIQIELTDQLVITNNLVPKKSKKIGGGRALKNLSQQYQLLTEQPLEITKSETIFVVKVPIIKSKSQ